jgi:hypothetical protein
VTVASTSRIPAPSRHPSSKTATKILRGGNATTPPPLRGNTLPRRPDSGTARVRRRRRRLAQTTHWSSKLPRALDAASLSSSPQSHRRHDFLIRYHRNESERTRCSRTRKWQNWCVRSFFHILEANSSLILFLSIYSTQPGDTSTRSPIHSFHSRRIYLRTE